MSMKWLQGINISGTNLEHKRGKLEYVYNCDIMIHVIEVRLYKTERTFYPLKGLEYYY